MELQIDPVGESGRQGASFSLARHLGFCLELRGPKCWQATLLPLRTSPGSKVAIQGARAILPMGIECLVGWLMFWRSHVRLALTENVEQNLKSTHSMSHH